MNYRRVDEKKLLIMLQNPFERQLIYSQSKICEFEDDEQRNWIEREKRREHN